MNMNTNQQTRTAVAKTRYQIVQDILAEIRRRQGIIERHNKAIAHLGNAGAKLVVAN
jgi:hypothetical protein